LRGWPGVGEGATAGPWYWEQPGEKENGFVVGLTYPPSSGLWHPWCDDDGNYDNAPDDYPEPVEQVCEQWGATVNYRDAAFIASARTAMPALLNYCRGLEDALAAQVDATAGLLCALMNEGHTEHCAKRLAWGDGECECGGLER